MRLYSNTAIAFYLLDVFSTVYLLIIYVMSDRVKAAP